MSLPTTTPDTIKAKAVTYSTWGGYDVIKIAERDVRSPGPEEIRIKVRAAAINPTDILMRDPGYRDTPPPVTPGMDAAGVVEAIGSKVDRFSIGDEVMAVVGPVRQDGGAQAAYVVISAASAVPKPKNLTLVEAATLPMNALTALYALDHAQLTSGQVLAVSGGAGWLASLAIRLAKHIGLRVIADAKPEEIDLVRRYGADIVVERGSNFAEAVRAEFPEGADALLDTALLAEEGFAAIKVSGIYIPVRGWDDSSAERGIQIKPVLVYEVLERTDWLDRIRDLAENGTIVPHIAGEYRPEDVADAQRRLMAGGVRGRPVIVF